MNLDLSKEDKSGEYPNLEPRRHYVALVLDRSGSMLKNLDATINSFNQQIDAIKSEADFNTKVSLVTFGSDVTPMFFNRPASRLEHLNRSNYIPEGWTAEYDAIGYTIRRLENEAEYAQNSTFLVVIISDGYENRSTEYNAYSIGNLINQKQRSGRWTFTYAGCNQDLGAIAKTLNIPIMNTFTFQDTAVGYGNMALANSIGVSTYLRSAKEGQTSSDSFYTNTQSSDKS